MSRLVPALSATVIYLIINEIRRKRMLSSLDAPEDAPTHFGSRAVSSRLA